MTATADVHATATAYLTASCHILCFTHPSHRLLRRTPVCDHYPRSFSTLIPTSTSDCLGSSRWKHTPTGASSGSKILPYTESKQNINIRLKRSARMKVHGNHVGFAPSLRTDAQSLTHTVCIELQHSACHVSVV
jgi:hypothetical protein